jgi:hypothetical protein
MGDPLLGPAPPPATQPTPPANAAAQGGLPPIPANTTNATTAALAGQTPPLAITAADSWIRKVDATPSPAGTINAPITPVSQPKVYAVPRDDGFAANAGQPIQTTGSWAATNPTTAAPNQDQLKQLLDQRHVIGQSQDNVPGGVHLVCIVNLPPSTTNQRYETTAVDYATAVQAIVQQIDQHP